MDYSTDYLAHYGVIGMKWGVRRYQPYSSKPRKSGKGGKEIGEAKQKRRETAKKVLKTTGTVAAVGAAAYFGPKIAFNAAVQYYLHKPKIDAALVSARKAIDKVPLKELNESSLVSYTKKVAAITGAIGATTKLTGMVRPNKTTSTTNSVTKKAATEILDKYRDKKMSEIDPNELQRSVQFLNNLNTVEQYAKGSGSGKKSKKKKNKKR